MDGSNLPRRRFLQVAASGAAVATVSCGGSQSPWRALTSAEATTLAALCDQIIPADRDPGATQAGILEFLDRQLAGRYKRHRGTYRDGMQSLDQLAQSEHGRPFHQITDEQRLSLLTRLDSGAIGKGTPAAKLFPLAVAHVMQGFYGPPRHGGNRNGVSWAMLGVPVRPVRGRTGAVRS